MKQAYEIVYRLYGRGEDSTVGWLQRKFKTPKFVVGYTSIDEVSGAAKAHRMGTSNVDWFSAFMIATDGPRRAADRARLMKILPDVLEVS